MIGIIGYGMVGKAIEYGFSKCDSIISDPLYNTTTVKDVCDSQPEAIFVCVPTPTDNTNYSILRNILEGISKNNYLGIVVVKSTVLPKVLEQFDVVYNPEFLSRSTSFKDFIKPPFVVLGGNKDKCRKLVEIYESYSIVDLTKIFITDIKTAALSKYTMNCFYALKVTYLNQIYDVAQQMGVDYNELADIISNQPWMGTHHFQVPGPDGQRGYGGPCLPKDTEALTNEYQLELLNTVINLNKKYRK